MLDEVTSGVDPRSIPGLVALIGRLRDEGTTLVVIEHNMRVIMSIASRIIALHLGWKLADRPPGEVVKDRVLVEAHPGPRTRSLARRRVTGCRASSWSTSRRSGSRRGS